MAEETKIEWADSSWNPWIGCTEVSPGCARCYAKTLDRNRFSKTLGGGSKSRPISHWGKGAPRHHTSVSKWKEPVKWNRMHVTTARLQIFPSMCDWLDDEVPIEWLADFLRLIHETPNLDWLLLTKRPENFWGRELPEYIQGRLEAVQNIVQDGAFKQWLCLWGNGQPPANIWIGTSVENQEYADKRIPELLKIPAKVRFLSVEPMLGPVDLELYLGWKADHEKKGLPEPLSSALGRLTDVAGVDWVIFGGESGKSARPCNVDWIRNGVKQCQAAGVKVFVKQLGSSAEVRNDSDDECWPGATIPMREDYEPAYQGEMAPLKFLHPKGGDPLEWPEDLRVREFPVVG